MATDNYASSNGQGQASYQIPTPNVKSPTSQPKNPLDTDLGLSKLKIGPERVGSRPEMDSVSAIRVRKLPRNTTQESLRSMLLFAKDFVGADFVPSDSPEDQGFLTAVARFRSHGAAHEVQSLLHGKQNTPHEVPLVIEVLRLSPGNGASARKNHFEALDHRGNPNSTANPSSGQIRQSSRFNGAFQSMDRISPPNGLKSLKSGHATEGPDIISPRSNFFPPHTQVEQRQRVSGKAVIGEDGADEEPSDLLKDPIGYANGEISGSLSRRSTATTTSSVRYPPLSLSTSNATSPPMSGFTSPRTAGGPLQSPLGPLSPTAMPNMGPNGAFQMPSQHFQRHPSYPPVNPADQNPPCNTLYVGNLPIDTSEDELKAMFSKQRGYKRLCFRTKQNGPMCFVEFEDISFATKALNELYGHPLHNSVKGGIRLSFSKNPLGVRTGQPGGAGQASPMSPTGGAAPAMNGMAGFSTASGPPPGLVAPPGLNNNHVHHPPPPSGSHPSHPANHAPHNHNHSQNNHPNHNMNGMMSPTSGMGYGVGDMGMGGMGMNGMRGAQSAGGGWNSGGGGYDDFVYGR